MHTALAQAAAHVPRDTGRLPGKSQTPLSITPYQHEHKKQFLGGEPPSQVVWALAASLVDKFNSEIGKRCYLTHSAAARQKPAHPTPAIQSLAAGIQMAEEMLAAAGRTTVRQAVMQTPVAQSAVEVRTHSPELG